MHRRRALDWVIPVAVLAAFVLVWWAVAAARLVSPLYLPGPGAVWTAAVDASSCHRSTGGSGRWVCGVQGYFLWEHLLASLRRIGVGVGAGILAGTALGFVLASSRILRIALGPYLDFLRALPPLGYIGLLIVWAGMGDASKYWLLFLAAFPPIVLATIEGVAATDADRIRAAQSLGANRLQTIATVTLPSALPSILAGVRLATGFAWTTVVAAELNNGIPGIGGTAYLAGQQVQTALVIACIILIGLVAVALDRALVLLGRVLVPWQGRSR